MVVCVYQFSGPGRRALLLLELLLRAVLLRLDGVEDLLLLLLRDAALDGLPVAFTLLRVLLRVLLSFTLLRVLLTVLVLVLILVLVLVLVLILILVLVLILLSLLILVLLVLLVLILLIVTATAALIVLVEQPLGVGVVVFGLHVVGVQPQRLAVAFECLLVLLLLEPRIAQVVPRLGPFGIRTQRVGRGLHHRLLGAVVHLGLVEGIAQVVGRLELSRDERQGRFVALDGLLVVALVVFARALAHLCAFGHALCHGSGRHEEHQQQDM